MTRNQPTRTKICGLTNLDDALHAMSVGADYLGFVLYPKSKRAVDEDQVAAITSKLRVRDGCPRLVGVFVDESAETMAAIMERCRLDLVQLNGDEPSWMLGDPESPIFSRGFKALKPISLPAAKTGAERYARTQSIPSLLIDAYHPTLPGGTGQTADWEVAAKISAKIPGMMLAGGLNPENVGAAITKVHPFAVDVASGVERFPGRKDPALVKLFIQRAREK